MAHAGTGAPRPGRCGRIAKDPRWRGAGVGDGAHRAPADILDSPHWFTAYWPRREAKDEFLLNSGLDVLGDKYLDGNQAAQILGVKLR